eukprot:4799356-Alexandrium_andersonii.AAC.1
MRSWRLRAKPASIIPLPITVLKMRMVECTACSASGWRSSSQLLRIWRSCSQAAVTVGGRPSLRASGAGC